MAKIDKVEITQEELLQLLAEEFKLDEYGRGSASRKATASLLQVPRTSLIRLLDDIERGCPNINPIIFGSFIGQSFKGCPLPDTLITAIALHYTAQGNPRCLIINALFSASGLRGQIRAAQNWNPTPVNPQEVVALLTQERATIWVKRFEDPFYSNLSRLTGLKQQGHLRPNRWGQLTNELVYDYLPHGVSDALRRAKKEQGSWCRLHQFLSDEGIKVFEKHMNLLITLMEASASMDCLKEALKNHCTRTYQMRLPGVAA